MTNIIIALTLIIVVVACAVYLCPPPGRGE